MFHGEVKAGDHVLEFGDVTHVVGVINVSPESKNPHTVAPTPQEALALAHRYRRWGADLMEVGGQSSHYDNPTLSAAAEIDRVAPVIRALTDHGFVVAVDTWKPPVAKAAIDAGAVIVNDTGGLSSPEMRSLFAAERVAAVAVHVGGRDPHDVGDAPFPGPGRLVEGFQSLMDGLDADQRSRLIVDPGIAINYRGDYDAYTRMQMEIIRNSGAFAVLKRPLMIPIPRKADIHWVTAYITLALEYGADLIRVHDVAVAADLVALWGRKVPE